MDSLKFKIERNLLEKIIQYIDLITQIIAKSSSSFESDLFQQVILYFLSKLLLNISKVNMYLN